MLFYISQYAHSRRFGRSIVVRIPGALFDGATVPTYGSLDEGSVHYRHLEILTWPGLQWRAV
jgi:hypothetical protein